MKCGFCGHEFSANGSSEGCAGCALSKSCGKVCCPRCGFEMAKRPGWLSRLGLHRAPAAAGCDTSAAGGDPGAAGCDPGVGTSIKNGCSMHGSRPGETLQVVSLDTSDKKRLKQLIALGVLPGTRVQVEQVFPAYVFRAGHTTIAVDENTARGISVLPIRA